MTETIIDPGGTGHEVTEVWAWVVVHGPKNESIAAFDGGALGMLPMLASDYQLAAQLSPFAVRIRVETGKQIELRRFRLHPVPGEEPT